MDRGALRMVRRIDRRVLRVERRVQRLGRQVLLVVKEVLRVTRRVAEALRVTKLVFFLENDSPKIAICDDYFYLHF